MHWVVPDDKKPAIILWFFPQLSMTRWKDAYHCQSHEIQMAENFSSTLIITYQEKLQKAWTAITPCRGPLGGTQGNYPRSHPQFKAHQFL